MLQIGKWSLIGNVIDQQSTDGPFIVCAGDSFKGLLACSVPYLDFDGFVLDLADLRAKLHSECGFMLAFEFVIEESQQKARFAHIYITSKCTAVPNHDEFEQVFVVRHRRDQFVSIMNRLIDFDW